mgnify:CR=1 FL=1
MKYFIFFIDVLNHLLSALVLKVNINIRGFFTCTTDETLEQQSTFGRIYLCDAQRITNRRVRRRPAPLAEDALRAREGDDVVAREEVRLIVEFLDERELALDLLAGGVGNTVGIAGRGPFPGEIPQVLDGRLPRRARAAVSAAAGGGPVSVLSMPAAGRGFDRKPEIGGIN